MAKVAQITSYEQSISAGSTTYIQLANIGLVDSTTEARRQVTYRSAGTLSDLFANIATNSLTTTLTVTVRKNGADGNQSVSVSSATTGTFEDTSNTDTVSAGDEFGYEIDAPAGSGSATFMVLGCCFAASSNTVVRVGETQLVTWLAGSGTRYLPYGGRVGGSTETDYQCRINVAGTLKNLYVYISTNSVSATSSVTNRVNGSDGNLTVSISASTTGTFEDTSNTDSISAGDDVALDATVGASGGPFTLQSAIVEFETTGTQSFTCGSLFDFFSFGTTTYMAIGGAGFSTTENDVEYLASYNLKLSYLSVYARGNSIPSATTVKTRVNGADGNQSVSVTASTTGRFEDTSNTDTVASGETVNLVASNAGGSGTIIISSYSLVQEKAPVTIDVSDAVDGDDSGNAVRTRTIDVQDGVASSESVSAESSIVVSVSDTVDANDDSETVFPISILHNSTEISNLVAFPSLEVTQNLTNQADTASFSVRKYGSKSISIAFDDDIEIYDHGEKIFGGKVAQVSERVESGGGGVVLDVSCVDHTFEFDRNLVSRVYEDETIGDIIDDIVTSYAATFTATNVISSYTVEKVVFNQVPPSQCLKRLADIVRFDWYIDPDKDIHFFPKETNTAPFDLTDTDGNYIYKSLQRISDGTQITNRIKVRGGKYDGEEFTDVITVKGNDSKTFKLPYQFSNLVIELDTGGGYSTLNVGIDFVDDFTSDDVLYNFSESTIRFENALADGDKIRFTGNPKIRVFAIAEDSSSIAQYGTIEKLIRENDIQSNTIARKRAVAELLAYNENIVDAKFSTYTQGLRAGMLINAQSDIRGFDDDLLIKKVQFKSLDPQNFYYKIDCVSTKRNGLIEMLQKILEPEAQEFDETEVSEEIFAANETLRITESTEMVTAETADEDLNTSENYELDPLGAGVEPIWVTSPYTPTSQSDTKRPGRTEVSFKTASS